MFWAVFGKKKNPETNLELKFTKHIPFKIVSNIINFFEKFVAKKELNFFSIG